MTILQSTSAVSPWIPIVISVISLLMTLIVAYTATLKRSRPSLLVGSRITIYPAPYQTAEKMVWGGTGIYIPMTFFNWSPNGGSVVDCRLNISKADNPNEVFDIGWSEFHEMLHNERRMGYSGFAQPIPMPPRSSVTKTILFIWLPFSDNMLKVKHGLYNLVILVWTKSGSKPNIRQTFEFTIGEKEANEYSLNLKNENPLTIDVSIRETNRINSLLTKDQVKKIYG